MSNMAIWEKVCKTDPNYTKSFQRGGGFKGTAINAVYNAMRCTELFGPVGFGWGVDILSSENIPLGDEVVNVVKINFWYRVSDELAELIPKMKPYVGEKMFVPAFGQTKFVEKRSNGLWVDDEAPKKSSTDAFNKAFSWLGASADIFIGLFDDNKYVAAAKREFGDDKTAAPKKVEKIEPKPGWTPEIKAAVVEFLPQCKDEAEVRKYWSDLIALTGITKEQTAAYGEMVALFNARASQLREQAKVAA